MLRNLLTLTTLGGSTRVISRNFAAAWGPKRAKNAKKWIFPALRAVLGEAPAGQICLHAKCGPSEPCLASLVSPGWLAELGLTKSQLGLPLFLIRITGHVPGGAMTQNRSVEANSRVTMRPWTGTPAVADSVIRSAFRISVCHLWGGFAGQDVDAEKGRDRQRGGDGDAERGRDRQRDGDEEACWNGLLHPYTKAGPCAPPSIETVIGCTKELNSLSHRTLLGLHGT